MSIAKKFLATVLLIFVVIALLAFYSLKTIKQGAEAYLFAYPLVLMELTREATAEDTVHEMAANHLSHMRVFPDHNFRTVVRPNDDTLYSTVWFDLSDEPMVISTPKVDRYYVLPFMDAWTNVFDSIGTRATGNEAGDYVLVGPDWQGELPKGVTPIKAPTNMVWMIGRIQTNGLDDIANVVVIKEQLSVTPLSRWPDGKANPTSTVESMATASAARHPKAELDALTATEFFNRFSQLLAKQPAAVADGPAIEKLREIGVVAGESFSLELQGWLKGLLIEQGAGIANEKLHGALEDRSGSPKENGWILWRDTIGDYGTNYKFRAGVALGGLGALPAVETAYGNTSENQKGDQLTGKVPQKIHFAPGQTPPADAFWSITLYDPEGYMVETEINRYLIGSRDPLKFNSDGSLDIYIQHSQPASGDSNWLPTPEGEYNLIMRIYQVNEKFTDGSWVIPPVEGG